MTNRANKAYMTAPLFLINGSKFLSNEEGAYFSGAVNNPGREYVEKTEQLVRSTRNANGQIIWAIVNRRLRKFEQLSWPYLSAESVTWLQKQIASFHCNLTYWDSAVGGFITRKYYWGDFEATPCEWTTTIYNGMLMKKPSRYKNVVCNLIDERILITFDLWTFTITYNIISTKEV